jgi:hypothetical protein
VNISKKIIKRTISPFVKYFIIFFI